MDQNINGKLTKFFLIKAIAVRLIAFILDYIIYLHKYNCYTSNLIVFSYLIIILYLQAITKYYY
jgi:hypothetical protein